MYLLTYLTVRPVCAYDWTRILVTTAQSIVLITLPDILLQNDWNKQTISNKMTGTLPYYLRSYLWNYRTDAVTPWFFRRKVTHAYGGIRRLNEHGVAEHEHDSRRLQYSTVFPDRLPILQSIPVFYLLLFLFLPFSSFRFRALDLPDSCQLLSAR